jgi:hypothetical protein
VRLELNSMPLKKFVENWINSKRIQKVSYITVNKQSPPIRSPLTKFCHSVPFEDLEYTVNHGRSLICISIPWTFSSISHHEFLLSWAPQFRSFPTFFHLSTLSPSYFLLPCQDWSHNLRYSFSGRKQYSWDSIINPSHKDSNTQKRYRTQTHHR